MRCRLRGSGRVTVGWVIILCVVVLKGERNAFAQETSKENLRRWVGQLDSADYHVRETATQRLMAVGVEAVEEVAQAAVGADPEQAWRAVDILQQWSIDDDSKLARRAQGALLLLARSATPSVAQPARRALGSWKRVRHDRAAQELRRLGGALNESNSNELLALGGGEVLRMAVIDAVREVEVRRVIRVEVGAKPREEPKKPSKPTKKQPEPQAAKKDVLPEPIDLVLPIPDVESLKPEDGQSHLRIDQNWRGGDEGLRSARRLINLTHLELHHAPLTDKAVAHLAVLPHLRRIQVNYGKISGDALRELRKHRPEISIFGTGDGYLGVNGEPTPEGFRIDSVFENTSAKKAGLRKGDTIVLFDGHRLTDLDSLSLCVFDRPVGHPFQLHVLRDGREITIEGPLGTRP